MGKTMRIIKRTLLFLAIFINQRVISAEPLTLPQCLQKAFQVNRLLQVAELDFRSAELQWSNAKAQKYPNISASANYTRVGKVTSFTIPMGPVQRTFQFGTPNRINGDVRLQWPIFTWGRIHSSIEVARLGMDLSSLQRRQQQLTLTDQILRAYYALLLNQRVISVHQLNLLRAQQHRQTALQRFRTGYVSNLDTLRAQNQLQNAYAMLKEAELNLSKSRVFLAQLLRMDPEELQVAGELSINPILINEQELLQKALSLRPELSTLDVQQQMAEEAIVLNKSFNKPNLSLFSTYLVQNGFDPMEPNKFVDNWNIGVQLSLPLFDGFANSYKTQQAQLQVEKIRLQQSELKDRLATQVRVALIGLQQSEAKVEAQKVNIELARAALQTAESRYRDGLASSLDVIDAQQTLAQAELGELQWRFNHIMAKIELCNAIGDYQLFEW